MDLIHGEPRKSLYQPTGPADFHPLKFRGRAQTKVDPHVVARNIARAAADFIHQSAGRRLHTNSRPDAVAIRLRAFEVKGDPMIRPVNLIYEKAGLSIHVADDSGDSAVIPKIADGEST